MRINRRILGLLSALVIFSAPAYAEEGAAGYNLTDNVIEFAEIPQLVAEYSMLGKIEAQLIESSTQAMRDVRQELAGSRRELIDGLNDSIEDIRTLISETDDEETKTVLRRQIQELEKAKNGRGSGALLLTAQAIDGLSQSEKDMKKAEKNASTAISSGFYTGKKQFSNGMQGLFYTYKGMELTERLLVQQGEMYRSRLEKLEKQQALGSATSLDLNTARAQLMGAENNLLKLRDGLDSMKRTLGISLGWSNESYSGIVLSEAPVYPVDYPESRSLDADIDAAMRQNADYGAAQRLPDKKITTWDNRDITLAELEQKLRLEMNSLYQELIRKRDELNASETSAELARLKKEKAERMSSVGLVGNADYIGLKLDYISKQNAAEQARLDYSRAVFNYSQAVELGILSLD